MKLFEYQPVLLSTLKNYDRKTLPSDIMSGVIVGIVALPLAIAFAIASGVSPEKGIITAIIAGFIISVFGGSKVQIGGPTGAFIVIVYGIIEQYGLSGLMVATAMAGCFLILLGVLKLGTIIKYIPYPIVVGFTSGIALTIFSTQVKDLLGLNIAKLPSDFIEKWIVYFQSFNTISLWNAAVGILSILIIVYSPRLTKKVPGSLVAIIFMTLLVWTLNHFFGIEGITVIGDRFSINGSVSTVAMPELNWDSLKQLVSPAVTIALLGAIESLLSATVADGMIGEHHDSNSELIGQGIANIIVPLFGGIPATGAIARTMTNINNGGRSPIAGVIHAIVLLLIFFVLMPLAQYIPMACLAGVLVVVSYNMSGWRTFKALLKSPKSDVAILIITFLLTVIFDLTVAIEIGLIIACLFFMKRVSESVDVRIIQDEIDPTDGTDLPSEKENLVIPPQTEVYEINGPYFFGAGNRFDDLISRMRQQPKVRIIRMRRVPFVDCTGIHNLAILCERSKKEGIQIVLSGVQTDVKVVLEKAGIAEIIGTDNICNHINAALQRAKELVGE